MLGVEVNTSALQKFVCIKVHKCACNATQTSRKLKNILMYVQEQSTVLESPKWVKPGARLECLDIPGWLISQDF